MDREYIFLCGTPHSGVDVIRRMLIQSELSVSKPEDSIAVGIQMLRFFFGENSSASLEEEFKKLLSLQAWNVIDVDRESLFSKVQKYYEDSPCADIQFRYRDIGKLLLSSVPGTGKYISCNGMWLPNLEALELIADQKAKMIVPIRNMAKVLAEEESKDRELRAKQRTAVEKLDYWKAQTMEGRCELFLSREHLIGIAANWISDAVERGFRDQMLLIDLEEDQESDLAEKLSSFIEAPIAEMNLPDFERHSDIEPLILQNYSDFWERRGVLI